MHSGRRAQAASRGPEKAVYDGLAMDAGFKVGYFFRA
jgi:hypothetical protein